MRRLLIPVLLVLGWAAPAQGGHSYESERLEFQGDVPEAWVQTSIDLVDALYPRLERHFGRGPEDTELPMRLRLYRDRAAYTKALQKQGVKGDLGHSGGWTFWNEGVSHVFLQKDDWHTRRLILHELTHQFYAKCRPAPRRGQGAWWYREGFAEFIGWHRLGKQGYVLGDMGDLTRRGTLRDVRETIGAPDFDPWAILTRATPSKYASALAVVAPLVDGSDAELRKRFAAWEREILPKGGDTQSFIRRFEDVKVQLAASIRRYWDAHQPAVISEAGAWRVEEGVYRGRATEEPAELRLSGVGTTTSVQVELHAANRAGAGIKLGSATCYYLIVLHPDRLAVLGQGLEEEAGQALKELASLPFQHGGVATLEVRLTPNADNWNGGVVESLRGHGIRVTARSKRQTVTWPSPGVSVRLERDGDAGLVGLCVMGGDAIFRDLQTTSESKDTKK